MKKILFTMKESFMIRALCYPYCRIKRTIANYKYFQSEEAEKIRKLKDIHQGKRCFIIGSGPSLKVSDLELLNGEISFAANRIYRIFEKTNWRPTYYVAFEPEFTKDNIDELIAINVKEGKFLNIISKKNKLQVNDKVYWINCYSKFMLRKQTTANITFSDDMSKFVSDGYTVSYTMLQIAIYMGFNEIYLIGMDHNKKDKVTNHFYKDSKKDFQTPSYWEGMEYAYSLARKEAESRGIKIYNATRGGKLEVFERRLFQDIRF